ncbi:MAG TPA: nuclear transport factor 2 family protein [Acidimicrobiales bacterium]|nr:nuclear transport factor 2 family protein [Acidimicrobiales bacterium]
MAAWHELRGIVWREGDKATIAYGDGTFLEVVVALGTVQEVATAAGLVRVHSADGTARWARPGTDRPVDRITVVRSAYERFNAGDIEGVLELVDPDVEWPDAIRNSTLHGREALRAYWSSQFDVATPTARAQDLVEVGDCVIAVAFQEVYDLDSGAPLGPPVAVSHRFHFRGSQIVRMELTALDEVPESIRARFRNALRYGTDRGP